MDKSSANQNNGIIEWETLEYEPHERSADWFWIMGTLVVLSVIVSIAFSNLLLALIIAIAAFAIYLYEIRPPQILKVKITSQGVQIGGNLYTYERIKYFCIDEDREGLPQLIIRYERPIMPTIHLSLEDVDPEAVRNLLKKYGEEEEHKKNLAEEISDWFGF